MTFQHSFNHIIEGYYWGVVRKYGQGARDEGIDVFPTQNQSGNGTGDNIE